MNIFVDVSELNRLALDLGRVELTNKPLIKKAVRKAGADIDANAGVIVARDTGYLASTLGHDLDPDELGVTNGPTANYGEFVELGTSRMAPQAYMGPSFDYTVPGFVDSMAEIGGKVF